MKLTVVNSGIHSLVGMAKSSVGMMSTHILGSMQWLSVQDNDHTQQQAAEHAMAKSMWAPSSQAACMKCVCHVATVEALATAYVVAVTVQNLSVTTRKITVSMVMTESYSGMYIADPRSWHVTDI